ncbi:hypothetical protein [Paragemmobacter ruber]|uniref:Uncharacterized protein n=1 Tax=Paragemmobacter ruber TaxID=1985673 RepID=A0ABW9YB72_9RHOB|nr:hypothetical protein [Rhodobacter ruber]NBE09311.1 hypothetical protein [Rhodobacter ruber]
MSSVFARLPSYQFFAIIVAGVLALYAMGYFDPVPEQSDDPSGTYLYYGPEGETRPAPGATAAEQAAAATALANSDYFGALAIGPGGRQGVWTGARKPELARAYALALCGDDCRVVAERLPLHRDPSRSEPVLTRAMAQGIATRSMLSEGTVAVGGANAWGADFLGKRRRSAGFMRDAAEDCEARRATEPLADTPLSEPCRVLRVTGIEDLRPRPQLYPAAFTIAPTEIAPATRSHVIHLAGGPKLWLQPYLPKGLHGTHAANGGDGGETVREAGWPEAGREIALLFCETQRRPSEGPCAVTHMNVPVEKMEGVLPVPPDVYSAFQHWQATKGPGAFALSPYGVWGSSHDMPDASAAIQRAADWCWYHSRRTWVYRKVNDAFLDPAIPCRIIAIRDR